MTIKQNEFQGQIYDTTDTMLDAITNQWATAGGENPPLEIDGMLVIDPAPMTWAMEAIAEWGLDAADEDDGPSSMTLNAYTADDMAEAFARFFRDRPDIDPSEWIAEAHFDDEAWLDGRINTIMNSTASNADSEGGVWVCSPQVGHWLGPVAKSELVRRLRD
jgi:hypothetical protein